MRNKKANENTGQHPEEENSTLGDAPLELNDFDIMPQFSAAGFNGLLVRAGGRVKESERDAAMRTAGFEEEKAGYLAEEPKNLIGQFRRLGPAGPAYQIMGLTDDGHVMIEIVYSDEKLSYPLVEILADPIAETIP